MSTLNNLKKFVEYLGPKEQEWMRTTLPTLIYNWFLGEYMSGGKSKNLTLSSVELEAASYHDTDALAVALFYLRHIYLKKIPKKLYRVTKFKKPPKGDTIELSTKVWKRSLTSWTTVKHPESVKSIETMMLMDGGEWYRLEWPRVDPNMVCGTYQSITRLVQDGTILFANAEWKRARSEFIYQGLGWSSQEEVLVYMQKHPIKCRVYYLGEPEDSD